MNEFFKSKIGKCFLYTLLCIFVFAVFILLGMFIAGNTNIFEWQEIGRFVLVLTSIGTTLIVINFNE